MAILTTLRFTPDSGAICIDQESWHIWRRKNWFSDHLYPLIDEPEAEKNGIEMIYAGVGHPPFHYEVAEIAKRELRRMLISDDAGAEEISVPNLGRIVLKAFQDVHRRRIGEKLKFLFNFGLDEFTAGEFENGGAAFSINQRDVKDRALNIINGKETTGYNPLSPPVEACLIGVDKKYGYSAFIMKEKEGVISFQSCWFESIGQGREGAAARFADLMNGQSLDARRQGAGFSAGLFTLLEAIDCSMAHYGQNGGFVRMIILDGSAATHQTRLVDIHDDRARLLLEIARARKAGLIDSLKAEDLAINLVKSQIPFEEAEMQMFQITPDAFMLGKFLRGYKLAEAGLPAASPENQLFKTTAAFSLLRRE